MYRLEVVSINDQEAILVNTDLIARELPSLQTLSRHQSGYLLPATRAGFMAAEAIAAPTEVSKEYERVRAQQVSPSEQSVNKVKQALRYLELDIDSESPVLLDHQIQKLAFFGSNSGYDASEQGTGKTRSTLAWLALLKYHYDRRVNCVVLVLPKGLTGEWQREAEALRPITYSFIDLCDGPVADRIEILRNSIASLNNDAITIFAVNYDVIARRRMRKKTRSAPPGRRARKPALEDALQDLPIDVLLLDEAFRVKSDGTAVWRSLDGLLKLWRSSRDIYCMALSGTPLGNNIGDLWSQFSLITPLSTPAVKDAFMRRYSQFKTLYLGQRQIQQPFGCADPVGLMTLLEPVWFRATAATCLNLPPPVWNQVELDMSPEMRSWYDAVEDNPGLLKDRPSTNEISEFLEFEEGESATLDLTGPLIRDLRLQQICGGVLPLETGPAFFADDVKWRWLERFVSERIANTETRMIIWCKYTHEIGLLTQRLVALLGADRVAAVWGSVDADPIKRSFQSRLPGHVQVIVGQYAKLSYGHNLQSGDHNVYWSPTFSFITRDQAEKRTQRMGRIGTLNHWDLIYRNTERADEHARDVLLGKRELAARLAPETVGVL